MSGYAPAVSAPNEPLTLRVATVATVFGLLLAASAALDWARFEPTTEYEGEMRVFRPITVTGFAGPLGMAGKLVAGLGALAAGAASFVVFTRGRGVGLTASRWMLYCAGFFGLAIYFLVRAWQFETYDGLVKLSSKPVHLVKQSNLFGLTLAIVLAAAGAVIALAGSYVSRRGPRA